MIERKGQMKMPNVLQHYINGQWVRSESEDTTRIVNPAVNETIAIAPNGTKAEIEHAIQVAYDTFHAGVWSEQSKQARADVLTEMTEKLVAHRDELASLEVENNGKTLREALGDVDESIETFRYYAALLRDEKDIIYTPDEDMQTMIVKEPIGVAGLIVPWNFPLLMSVWKIAPALAAGNTVILKPAEITPISAIRLFELMSETSLPKGVANLVLGTGAVVGQTMSESEKIDIVSFTGSTNVGKTITKAATTNMKKLSLELGGKSPNIIFADSDFEIAVDYALNGIFTGSGQVCSSGSRILVEASIYDQFVERYVERAKQIVVGPGNDEHAEMGAIVSEVHMDSILDYIKIGQNEGARLASGGKRLEGNGLEEGFFIEPTVFTDVTKDMRIVQEEIFGPVVTIQAFTTEKEAIELANDTIYGLAGAVFSNDYAKAMRVIKKVRAGITAVNNYHLTNVQAPWGGYKQSGTGRSLGPYGLDEYQETKQINVLMHPEMTNWFKNE